MPRLTRTRGRKPPSAPATNPSQNEVMDLTSDTSVEGDAQAPPTASIPSQNQLASLEESLEKKWGHLFQEAASTSQTTNAVKQEEQKDNEMAPPQANDAALPANNNDNSKNHQQDAPAEATASRLAQVVTQASQPETVAQPQTLAQPHAHAHHAHHAHHHAHHSRHTSPAANHTTRVNGIGIWNAWKRSFSTRLLALLDLIDNSLDASIQKHLDRVMGDDNSDFIGRVHVLQDLYQDSASPNPANTGTVTGLCIINNCLKRVRPLEKVLEVYNSSKINSGAGDIGENGIGLKQGCATLCDLSFVFVKNGSNDDIELGIIASMLQKEEGCYLPAFKFSNGGDPHKPSLKQQMLTLFSKPEHQDVARCIAKYGSANAGCAHNLHIGIDRLCDKFDNICNNFHNNPYVFGLVLDKIRHGRAEHEVGRGLEQKIRVNSIMTELQEQLPKNYLHIPDTFEFRINKNMAFKYWPHRLVEFSSFNVTVGTKTPWWKSFDSLGEDHPDSYKLRIFLGFDRERISQKAHIHDESGHSKAASLYIYSRQSGRLIKYETDARTLLGLSAGGTDFCSALTIIVDDIGGNLPLNPTKQDVAFGEEESGDVHMRNLYSWIGAVTNFYYMYHRNKYGHKKLILTRMIQNYGGKPIPVNLLKTCDSSKLTTFDLEFKANGRKSIRVKPRAAEEHVGQDTIFRLFPEEPPRPTHIPQAAHASHNTHPSHTAGNKRSYSNITELHSPNLAPPLMNNGIAYIPTRPQGAVAQAAPHSRPHTTHVPMRPQVEVAPRFQSVPRPMNNGMAHIPARPQVEVAPRFQSLSGTGSFAVTTHAHSSGTAPNVRPSSNGAVENSAARNSNASNISNREEVQGSPASEDLSDGEIDEDAEVSPHPVVSNSLRPSFLNDLNIDDENEATAPVSPPETLSNEDGDYDYKGICDKLTEQLDKDRERRKKQDEEIAQQKAEIVKQKEEIAILRRELEQSKRIILVLENRVNSPRTE